MTQAGVESGWQGNVWTIRAQGAWDLEAADQLVPMLDALNPERAGAPVQIDLSGLERLDTVGVLLARRLQTRLNAEVSAIRPEHQPLFTAVPAEAALAVPAPVRQETLADMIEQLGINTLDHLRRARNLVGFFGLLIETAARSVLQPHRLRLTSLVFHMQQTGLNALPVLGLLSFLIGVVLAYQGADQLRAFGADLYVVNLLGISILREIGVLLTAIIVAGRSGSAFTAQIGTMNVNQEIDAMQTLGLDPIEQLVLPRTLALVLVLPLLAFYGNMVALIGGALMSWLTLDITLRAFLTQLQSAITLTTLWVGLVKAPVFAFVIAMVGCYQGLRVTGSAQSVGVRTTQSVVQSIFLVIIIDALFSIAFSIMKI